MTRSHVGLMPLVVAALFLFDFSLFAEAANSGPAFKDVFDLARRELKGIPETELDQLSARGLMAQLEARGLLLIEEEAVVTGSCVASSNVFDESFGYIRLARVGPGVGEEFEKACSELGQKSKLKGLVVDLRFADGSDYSSAAGLADLFFAKAQPILSVGDGQFRSHERGNSISLPTAILINGRTSVAAEAVAAILREAGAGLLLGDTTAGLTRDWRKFTLADGTRVALAGEPVKLGNGKPITAGGLVPDIVIKVKLDEEQKFLADPYYEAEASVAARAASRQRLTEAQLVREHNGSRTGVESPPALKKAVPEAPVVQDPVLARALDLLKGLAVVRGSRPS